MNKERLTPEQKKEKRIVYSALWRMTLDSKSEEYFSKIEILNYIKKGIETNYGIEIYRGKGYVVNNNAMWTPGEQNLEVDLDGMLPKLTNMKPILENLVQREQVEFSGNKNRKREHIIKDTYYRTI